MTYAFIPESSLTYLPILTLAVDGAVTATPDPTPDPARNPKPTVTRTHRTAPPQRHTQSPHGGVDICSLVSGTGQMGCQFPHSGDAAGILTNIDSFLFALPDSRKEMRQSGGALMHFAF